MDKGKFFSGLFIMIGLVVIGFHLTGAVGKYRSYDRTVNVKGLCEKEVKADKVIWPVVYKVMANDIQSIYDQIDANNEIVMSFLDSGGIKTDEISVAVPNISDKYANEYGSNDRAYRYIATSVLTVCTSDVDAVLDLMSRQAELLKKGVITGGNNWENPVEFKYEGLNAIKPQMIEEATKNAREAALKAGSVPIEGLKIVPNMREFFADAKVLHPNELGFNFYANGMYNVIKEYLVEN